VTFVIDRGGVVRMRFDSQIQARKHVSEALEMVRTLAKAA
jgi:peroxiredoxin